MIVERGDEVIVGRDPNGPDRGRVSAFGGAIIAILLGGGDVAVGVVNATAWVVVLGAVILLVFGAISRLGLIDWSVVVTAHEVRFRRRAAPTVRARERTFLRDQFAGYGGTAGRSSVRNSSGLALMTSDLHTVGGVTVRAPIAEIDQVMARFGIPRLKG